MTNIYLALMSFLDRDEEGQGLAEYALILALVAILAVTALGVLSGSINGMLTEVGRVV